MAATETNIPNAEAFIKSISEQGYTLETSIADLIDNSISAEATRVEVLIDTQRTPFTLFIADDGAGMSESELKKNMRFPSSSMEELRQPGDLGRFGLGLKTASFAQTRCLTVISKKPKDRTYNARTWDLNFLKGHNWEILVNTQGEIKEFLQSYLKLSQEFLNPHQDFAPNTIVIWTGLYKFENDNTLFDKSSIIQRELSETAKEHLQLIFHRFMERKNPLRIRLNNEQLVPFNPFPKSARNISIQQKLLIGNKLRLEGFVLPNRSIAESKESSEWTLTHRSLMDMEGMYIYRDDRIIVFGGWNGVIKKSPRLQLARLKVEIGNGIDHLFHLNVAKSSIAIPFGERVAFIRYVSILKKEAEKEFYNHETRASPAKSQFKAVFKKVPTNSGMALEIDDGFPLLVSLNKGLDDEQKSQLKIILKMISTTVNKIRKVHTDDQYSNLIEKGGVNEENFRKALLLLLETGQTKEYILKEVIPSIGITPESLPPSVLKLLQ